MRTLLVILLFLAASAAQLKAETTVKQYTANKKTKELAFFDQVYIYGLGEAFELANVALVADKRAPFFCMPENLSLNMDNYVDIVDRQITARAEKTPQAQLEETWLSILLLQGLKDAFPCKGK